MITVPYLKYAFRTVLMIFPLLFSNILNAWTPEDGVPDAETDEHPFIASCRLENLEAIDYYLKQADFDPNSLLENSDGKKTSGLLTAVFHQKLKAVEQLVKNERVRIEPEKNTEDPTPVEVATTKGFVDILKLLTRTKSDQDDASAAPIQESTSDQTTAKKVASTEFVSPVYSRTPSFSNDTTAQIPGVSHPPGSIQHPITVDGSLGTDSNGVFTVSPLESSINLVPLNNQDEHKSEGTFLPGTLSVYELLRQSAAALFRVDKDAKTAIHETERRLKQSEQKLAEAQVQLQKKQKVAEEHSALPKTMKDTTWRSSPHNRFMKYNGKTPLINRGENSFFAACRTGNVETISDFLEQDSELANCLFPSQGRIPKGGTFTGLYLASLKGHLEAVKTLVERGASPGIATSTGEYPISIAAARGYWDVVSFLLSHAAPITKCYYSLLEPYEIPIVKVFHLACHKGKSEIVKIFVDENRRLVSPDMQFPVNTYDTPEMQSALYIASAQGHVETVRILLDAGCDVNSGITIYRNSPQPEGNSDSNGDIVSFSPLYGAARFNRMDVVKELLKRAEEINLEFSDTATSPLHIACQNDHYDIVQHLHDAGVSYLEKQGDAEEFLAQQTLKTLNKLRLIAHIQNGLDKNRPSLATIFPQGLKTPINDGQFNIQTLAMTINGLTLAGSK